MKAITLHQPYATLIAIGAKRIETRGWRTLYRGPLAIHAARSLSPEMRALCVREPFRTVLQQAGYTAPEKSPLGAVVATCSLVDCLPTGADQGTRPHALPCMGTAEWAFGNYAPDGGSGCWKTCCPSSHRSRREASKGSGSGAMARSDGPDSLGGAPGNDKGC